MAKTIGASALLLMPMSAHTRVDAAMEIPSSGHARETQREARAESAQAAHANLALRSETQVIQPGATFHLAIHLTLEEGWYLYWNGRNDSGLAPSWKLALPTGFTAAPPLWPVPTRHVAEGPIVDHIYQDELILLLPVTAPRDLAPDQDLTFGVDARWLACAESCVPESGQAELSLTSGPAPKASDAALFARARARQPQDAAILKDRLYVRTTFDAVRIQVSGASALAFFPARDCAELTDVASDAAAQGPELNMSIRRTPDEKPGFRGILEVVDASTTSWYTIDAALRVEHDAQRK